jgi:hypothetical protein
VAADGQKHVAMLLQGLFFRERAKSLGQRHAAFRKRCQVSQNKDEVLILELLLSLRLSLAAKFQAQAARCRAASRTNRGRAGRYGGSSGQEFFTG